MEESKVAPTSHLKKHEPVLYILGSLTAIFIISLASHFVYDLFPFGQSKNAGMGFCNVQGINLHGSIYTYIPDQGMMDDPDEYQTMYGDAISSEEIVYQLQEADNDNGIQAILIEVDSGGGSPVAGEEIANAIKELSKPVVAVIRQSGMSGAYWAISGTDRIIASQNSDIGSIGVTSSYLENISKDKKYVQLISGKFKDTGSPDRPITDEDRDLIMRDLEITHENFIQAVAQNRNMAIESVRAIADGSSMLGQQAKNLGLIDEIGSWTQAEHYLQEQIGEEVQMCW